MDPEKAKSAANAVRSVDVWNRKHKIGTDVIHKVAHDDYPIYTKTRSLAWVEKDRALISVEGIEGGVPLESIEVL